MISRLSNLLFTLAHYTWRLPWCFAIPVLLIVTSSAYAQSGLPASNAKQSSGLGALTQESQTPRFLSVEEAYRLSPSIKDSQLSLHWEIADGYYLYGPKFNVAMTHKGEDKSLAVQRPAGKIKHDEYFGDIEVHYGAVDIVAAGLPADGEVTLRITSQGCADAGLCYPPYTLAYRVDLANGAFTPVDPATITKPSSAAQTKNVPLQNSSPSWRYWLLMLSGAFFGGIMLNLMPCVFPVLSLKVLAFLRDEEHNHALHGVSYTGGVVVSFIATAAVLLTLREAGSAIGWGFQLQSPWFVALMVYLFFVLALNLSGVFEIGGDWTNSGNRLAQTPGYGGSFATGLLATLVASPCTAPFMGAALGFAVTQPALHALMIFAALGFGMAAPVLAMSLSPALLKRLPKPGEWMQTLKQLLAFPLYATALWLAWVLGNQTGVNGLIAILCGCLLLTLAITFWSRGTTGIFVALIALCISIAIPFSNFLKEEKLTPLINSSSINNGEEQPWSEKALHTLRNNGNAVFVNVTADWCITCLANEKLVLGSDDIKQLFIDKKITYLKADWTRYDAKITSYLSQFGRNGVPLYVYYPANNGEPVVLSQILRSDAILQTIESKTKD